MVVVLGDMNAKIGGDNINFKEIMSKEGCGQKNENGETFLEYCHTNNLVIGGSLFPHKEIHHLGIPRWSHEKPNRPYHN